MSNNIAPPKKSSQSYRVSLVLAAWCSGNMSVSINVVALHWAWLLLGWVTV